MMSNTQASRTAPRLHAPVVYKSVDYSAARILLGSLTAVETQNYVSTGKLIYVEGDLIEIQMGEALSFEPGDAVKATVYSPGGVYVFESSVVARTIGAIMLLNPPDMQNKFVEKRVHPRIDMELPGSIHAIFDIRELRNNRLEEQLPFTTVNISMGGLGLKLSTETQFEKKSYISIELDLGFSLSTVAEVIHKEELEEGYYYGVKFGQLMKEQTGSLRAYVLKNQIENHLLKRRTEQE